MAKAGGSATANGILYQILGTLGRAVDISLRAHVEGEDIGHAILVIEPIGGGGDLQILRNRSRIVEQWKSRTTNRPWSLNDLITDVLPDLFCAVDGDVKAYRFVTEGRIGHWEPALTFFKRLGTPPAIGSVIDRVDDTPRGDLVSGKEVSERALFLRVVNAVSHRVRSQPTTVEDLHRRVWHLLSRLEIEPVLAMTELVQRLDALLLRSIERVEDVEGKRHELCGRVLALAKSGNARIRPEQLLLDVGLAPRTFLAWGSLRDKMTQRLDRALRVVGFDSALNVRAIPSVSSHSPICVLTGESGQGKTWALAAMAADAAAGAGLSVWVNSARNGRHADDIAADEIWLEGIGHTGLVPLGKVAERRAQVNPHSPRPWALVCVDGVHSRQEAEYLSSLDWEGWGMRLALSASKEVAEFLRHLCNGRATIIELSDFTAPQLRDYLVRRGRSWTTTPRDLRDVIRRPILASLYCTLDENREGLPRHEYQLMERYWDRIKSHVSGGLHDYVPLELLADRLLEDNPVYPWPPRTLVAAGLSADILGRLTQAGWLRQMPHGFTEFGHDRLMCWAIAQSIVGRRRAKETTNEDLVKSLSALSQRLDNWSVRLGYVLLDAVWMLSAPDMPAQIRSELWTVVRALEVHGGHGFQTTDLYEHSLPTLGARIVPIILDRIRNAETVPHSPLPRLAACALLAIAARDSDVVQREIAGCLGDPKPMVQELGIRLASRLPDARYLNRLWELHRPLATATKNERLEIHALHELCFASLAACLQCDPAWVARKVGDPGEDVPLVFEMAYLLARTDGPAAAKVWSKSKARLIELVPPMHRRCILNCILRFRDSAELGRVSDWVASPDDLVGGLALVTLALFDPARAVPMLGVAQPHQLWLYSGQLHDLTMGFVPAQMCAEVRRLVGERPDEAGLYLRVAAAGDRVDVETMNALLDRLDAAVANHLHGPPDPHSWIRLGPLLEEVDGMRGRVPLTALRHRRGSTLELRLAEAAARQADNTSGCMDHSFVAAKSILLRIGGEGLTHVTNALLGSKSQHAQFEGCQIASIRPDARTRQLVADLSVRKDLWGTGPSAFPVVQQAAVSALAALQEGNALVRAVLSLGGRMSPDVRSIRSEQPALSLEDTELARRILDTPQHELLAHAVWALGLSGRLELRPTIQRVLFQSSPASEVALAAMLSLHSLGGRDEALNGRLVDQYRSGHHKHVAANLLVMDNNPEAIRLLREAIPERPPFDETDQGVISFLASREESRSAVAPQVRELVEGHGEVSIALHFQMPRLLDPRDANDRVRLWETAAKAGGAFHYEGTKASAIERLSELDPAAAFELAEESLYIDSHERSRMMELLLRVDGARAIPRLFEYAIVGYDQSVCRSVGIALRGFAGGATVHELTERLASDQWKTRRVAACITGYLGNVLQDRLRALVLSDGFAEVSMTAMCALRRQQRESEATSMVATWTTAQGPDAWALAEDIVHLADPALLTNDLDTLGFLAALRRHPFVLRKHVTQALEAREKEIERNLGSSTRTWKNE
jgi:hypothetical protein